MRKSSVQQYGRLLGAVVLMVGLLGIGVVSFGQTAEEPPVPVEIVLGQSGVAQGGTVDVAIIFDVPDDHHITDRTFGLFYWEPKLPEGFTMGEPVWPRGEMEGDEEVYRGSVVLTYTLNASSSAKMGSVAIPYDYSYQICRELDPEMCFLPNGGSGTLELNVAAPGTSFVPTSHWVFGTEKAAVEEAKAETASGGKLEDRLTNALESGSFLAFFLVFLAGILISFTPCVYPMIPIIIGFVGGGAGGSRAKGFVLSLFFVLGLAIVYAILGVIAGATGALFGAFMSNPIVLWFIVAIFIALGASMLGAFDITVPAALQGKMMSGDRSGVIGAMLIGGVTGIVAAPCAGPPLLVLLSWIGNTGNLVLGFFLMATFALGIGLLFIIIGTFAGAMTALPQAGPWMDKIKKGLGIIIFAVALYYLHLLLNVNIFLLVAGGFLLIVGLFMGAVAKWDELTTSAKLMKGLGMLFVLAGAFYFLFGLMKMNDVSLSAPAAADATEAVVVDENHVAWNVNMHDEIIARAKAENKPILMDFYADWCGVCVELDHKVWNQQSVIDATDGYLPLKLDFTRSTKELEALRKQYGVGGLPSVLILGPDGKERSRFSSFKTPEEVVAWLGDHR